MEQNDNLRKETSRRKPFIKALVAVLVAALAAFVLLPMTTTSAMEATTRKADSWKKLREVMTASSDGDIIEITQDIVANSSDVSGGTMVLSGDKTVTIKAEEGKNVTIWRKDDDANFSMFKTSNEKAGIIFGEGLTLSGQTGTCSDAGTVKPFEDFHYDLVPGEAVPEKKTKPGNQSGKFQSSAGYLYNYSNEVKVYNNESSATAIGIEVKNNKCYLKVGSSYLASDSNTGVLKLTGFDESKSVYFTDTSGTAVSSVSANTSYFIKDPANGFIRIYNDGYTNMLYPDGEVDNTNGKIAASWTSSDITTAGSGSEYWVVPGTDSPQFETEQAAKDSDEMKQYNIDHPKEPEKWIIPDASGVDQTYTDINAARTAYDAYVQANPPKQGCEGDGGCKTWTSSDFSGESANAPKGFFIQVDKGSVTLAGATLKNFVTDGSVEYAAPVVANGGTFNVTGGSVITQNSVGYAPTDNSRAGHQAMGGNDPIKAKGNGGQLNEYARTKSAGAVIYTNGASGEISGGSIVGNRGDAGALIVQGSGDEPDHSYSDSELEAIPDTTVEINGGAIDNNYGVHYAGAVQIYNGGQVYMSGGQINENYAWDKGGAVYALSEVYGSTKWMQPGSTKKVKEAVFSMSGGKMNSNTAVNRGGAINVESNGVSLWKGEIAYNNSRELGGAVYVAGDGVDRMYQMYVDNGCITGNRAVNDQGGNYAGKSDYNKRIDRALNTSTGCGFSNKYSTTVTGTGEKYYTNEEGYSGSTGDWFDYYGHKGNGGGLWLCAFGGNATFGYGDGANVSLAGNTSAGGSEDVYLSATRPNGGSGINIMGENVNSFKTENGNGAALQPNTIYTGVLKLKNTAGVQGCDGGVNIHENLARNGGGIAADGTVVFGNNGSEYRIVSDLEFTKTWDLSDESKKQTLKLKPFVELEIEGKDEKVRVDISNDYGVTLDGEKDYTSESEIPETAVVYESKPWVAKMGMPLTVTYEGKAYPLYTFTDSQGEELNPANPLDLAKIYDMLETSPDMKPTKWNLVIEEYDVNDNLIDTYTTTYSEVGSQGKQIEGPLVEYNKDKSGVVTAKIRTNTVNFLFEQGMINSDEEEQPEVEKYVNNQVHSNIVNFDQDFTYSVMAYVPKGATEVTITDTLKDDLEFVYTDAEKTKVITAIEFFSDNDSKGNGEGTVATGKVNGTNVKLDRGAAGLINKTRTADDYLYTVDGNTLTFTLKDGFLNTADDALFKKQAADLSGVWIKVTFKAQIKEDSYDEIAEKIAKINAGTENADATEEGISWEKVLDDKSTIDNQGESHSEVTDGKEVKGDGSHAGVANQAEYKVTIGDDGGSTYKTNTVTVEPETTKVYAKKSWKDEKGNDAAWPDDVDSVTVKVSRTIGTEEKEVGEIIVKKDNQPAVLEGLPKLKNASYSAEEVAIPGYTEVGSVTGTGTEEDPFVFTNQKNGGPQIEKYVNNKVHNDNNAFDTSFKYDIIAFVPVDADEIIIKDTLVNALEFAKAPANGTLTNSQTVAAEPSDVPGEVVTSIVVKDSNDHTVNGTVKNEDGTALGDAAVPAIDGQTLTVTIADATEYRGKYIQVTFWAKYTQAMIDAAEVGDSKTINGNGAVLGGQKSHTGTTNDASYDIRVENEWTKDVKSNPVTVKSKTTKLEAEKKWVNADGSAADWPEDVEKVEVNVLKGTDVVDTIELTAEKSKNTSKELPVLVGVEYKLDEVEVPGYTTTVDGTVFTNKKTTKQTTEATVTKVWDDEGDDSDRPENITVQLFKTVNGQKSLVEGYESIELSASAGWTNTIAGLDEKDDDGNEITYSFEEVGEVSGYISAVSEDGQTITNSKPQIEKYINKDVDAHLVEFDKTFTYDIMAYVPKNADSIEITDTLVDSLEFADTANIKVVAKTENDHKANGSVAADGTDVAVTPVVDGNTLTVTVDDAAGYRGQWIQVTFTAKYTQEAINAAQVADSQDVTDNGTVISDIATHDGTANTASYKIKVGNEWSSDYESNTVTHDAETVQVEAEKQWKNADGTDAQWPAGVANVKVKVKVINDKTGKQVATITLTADKTKAKSKRLPKLTDVTYSIKENTIPGYISRVDGNVVVNTEGEGPEVEKYVNNDVTYDFDNFDQTFEYEIMGYITNDATEATFTDELNSVLEFVDDGNIKVYDMGDIENDHKTTVAGAGDEVQATTAKAEGRKLTVSFNEEAITPLRGHWVKVTFNAHISRDGEAAVLAKLKEKAKSKENPKVAADGDAWANIDDNGTVLIEKEHDGVPNSAKLTMKTENNGDFDLDTNTVTVEPKTEQLKATKAWKNADGTDMTAWPDGAKVTFALVKVDAEGEKEIETKTLEKAGTVTFTAQPKISVVSYKVVEKSVEGIDALQDGDATVDDNTWTFTNKVNPGDTTVKISKTDLGGKELEGAEIYVYKTNDDGSRGDEVTHWTSETTAHELTLPAGDYVFVETVAPEGYNRVTTEIKFTVGEDGNVTLGTTTVDNGGIITTAEGDANHLILQDAPVGPEIEKYVNKDVHADIEEYDREFVYDVIAYVPMDATGITITDPLDDKLTFVSTADEIKASAVAIAKSNHLATSVEVEEGKTRSVEETGTPVTATASIKGQLLTVNVDNIGTGEGQQNIAGKSVRITFTAKIKANADGSYTILEDKDLVTINEDQPVISELNLDSGNKAGDHKGIKNGANYTITTANDAEGNPRYPETPSNEVTVIPETEKAVGAKLWIDDEDEVVEWPEGMTVDFDLVKEETKKGTDGNDIIDRSVVETITLKEDNFLVAFKEVAKLINVVYKVVEVPMIGFSEAYYDKTDFWGYSIFAIRNRIEKPEIEKFVGKAVHQYIKLDEVFTYDIVAYVTNDAETVTITDELNEKIKFAEDPKVSVTDLGAEKDDRNNHEVVYDKYGEEIYPDATVAKAGTPIDPDEAKMEIKTEGKKLTVDIANAKAYRGHWVKVTFNAMLDAKTVEEAEAAYEYVSATAEDETRDVPNVGNEPVGSGEDHNGVPNNASYVIGVKKAKLDEDGNVVRDEKGNVVVEEEPTPGYTDKSNTVTVQPEQPKIEKYVNQDVHKDVMLDETFTYDIIAYATNDATKLTITDELIKNLEFVSGKDDVKVVDLGTDNNHKTNSTFSGKNADASVAAAGNEINANVTIDGKKLEVIVDDVEGKDLRGHYIRVTFDAKLSADAEYVTIDDNGTVLSDKSHEGVDNQASYTVDSARGPYDKCDSNVVTVKPKKVSISKADMDGTEVPGAEITVKDSEGKVVETWTSKEESHEIALKPGTYTMVENVAPEGFKCVTTEITFTVDEEGKVTVVTTEVENGKVDVDENGKLILFDEPENPEIEKYVNYAVHKDITLKETFTYDIVAYVTTDADVVTIKDTLVEKIRHLEDSETYVFDLGTENNHKPAMNTAGTMINKDATVLTTGKEIESAEVSWDGKELTVVIPDAADYRGHWVDVLFVAELDISDTKDDGTKKTDAEKLAEAKAAFADFKADAVEKRAEPNVGNAPVLSEEDHTGVPNTASYEIGVRKVQYDENGNVKRDENGNVVKDENPTTEYSDTSNTVTVKPELPDLTKHEVEISKNSLGGTEIAGAHIKVTGTDVNGDSFETEWDSTTEPHVIKLAEGTYTMVETVAPEGFQRVTTEIVFKVDADGKVTVDAATKELDANGKVSVMDGDHIILEDAPNPDITISKSSLGGKEIAGAVIVLRDEKGKLVDTWTSTTETHTIEKLAPGRYVMKETVAPEGYQQVTTDMIFVVDKDGNVTLETTEVNGGGRLTAETDHINLEDAPIKPVSVALAASKTLVDESGERTLKAGEFTFTLSGADIETQTKTNAADGSVTFDAIDFGYGYDANGNATSTPVGTHTYTITETKGDDAGIVYDTTVKTVTVKVTKKGNDLVTEVAYAGNGAGFTNKVLQPGEITAQINANKTLKVNGSDAAPEAGEFSFEIREKGYSYRSEDGSSSTNEIEFENAPVIRTVSNDAAGNVDFGTFTYDKPGNYDYYISEVNTGEEGVTYDAAIHTVTVMVREGAPVEAEDGTVTKTLTATVSYPDGATFENSKETKKPVKISKTDIVTGHELPGATLVITDAATGAVVVDEWVSTSTPKTVELVPGDYVLTENLAPLGYNIATPVPFTVGENGLVGSDKVVMQDSANTVKEFYNIGVIIDKKWTDGRGNEVSWPEGVSAEFTLQRYDRTAGTWVDCDVPKVVLTAQKPTAVFEELPAMSDGATAQYRAVETKVAGYTQATSTVTNISAGIGTMTATNIPETPDEEFFEVLISKNSLGGSEIAGAHIKVYDAQGNTVENGDWISTTEAHQLTLKAGTYTMVETVAPEGYKQVTTAITFTVDNEGHVTLGTTTVDNGGRISVMDANHVILEDAPEDITKHKVKISKTDLGGTEIEGATMVLKDADGNIIKEWTSTKEAFVIDLAPGTYTMIETVAPEGFKRVTTEMTFTVGEDGKVTLVTAKVDNGGVIEVLEGDHIILKDAPEETPTKDKEKPGTTDTPTTTTTTTTPVTTRRAGTVSTSAPASSSATNTGDSNNNVLWFVLAAAAAAAIAGAAIAMKRRRHED